MPSPFPGMDPYLEGSLWPDVHARLAVAISNTLGPLVRPNFVVRSEVSTVRDTDPASEIGIMYPDVKVRRAERLPSPTAVALLEPAAAPVVLPRAAPVTVRIVSVQVREVISGDLVAVIEVISPANKHRPGLDEYAAKRLRLMDATVHLLEIDLIRRGIRLEKGIPATDYVITLVRAGADVIEAWPIKLGERLPLLPVPLRDPHPAVAFDLQALLDTIYEAAAYELSIDFDGDPPPPALGPEQKVWMRERVVAWIGLPTR